MRLKAIGLIFAATITGTAWGAEAFPFTDVSPNAWYRPTLETLFEKGWITSSDGKFRGTDTANRAEFTKLVVDAGGGFLLTHPAESSFEDVPFSAWFRPYFEEAALEGWIRGEGNCYGNKPCRVRPEDRITRAEAAALIVRSFGFEVRDPDRRLPDVDPNAWYAVSMSAAVDNCVLAGDDGSGNLRPADPVNRAEMAVMVLRADEAEIKCAPKPQEAGL